MSFRSLAKSIQSLMCPSACVFVFRAFWHIPDLLKPLEMTQKCDTDQKTNLFMICRPVGSFWHLPLLVIFFIQRSFLNQILWKLVRMSSYGLSDAPGISLEPPKHPHFSTGDSAMAAMSGWRAPALQTPSSLSRPSEILLLLTEQRKSLEEK